MDNRPIGVFDSGLGGLTAIRELERVLPGESLVYFGDTGRVPYGTKGKETIVKYAQQIVRFLLGLNVKAILVACGTVSSVAFDEVAALADVPVFGAVEPAVEAAVKHAPLGDILILGTSATVRSGSYEKAVRTLEPGATVRSKACPLFVPLVESGHFAKDDPLAQLAAHEYLDGFTNHGVETVILGCTHYPILRPLIADIMGESVTLIDAGSELADTAARKLGELGLLSGAEGLGKRSFFVSDYTEDFTRLAAILLEHPMAGYVEKTDIEKY